VGRKSTRTDYVFRALSKKGENLFHQSNSESDYSDSKAVYEEAYNLMAEDYDPTHPKVLTAANHLIRILIKRKEYFDAERYARICYDCLTQSNDNREQVAQIAEALAKINYDLVFQNGSAGGDVVEAEMLIRKSIRIIESTLGKGDFRTVSSVKLFLKS
jgi:hypothetical protein